MNENSKHKRELKLLPKGEHYSDFTFTDSEEELRNRFYRQKLEDLLNDNVRPFPTMILEEEDPEFLELIRPFILFGNMKPFSYSEVTPSTREELETKKIKNYGDLYCLVIPN
jgi:hypothetical protein